MGGSLLKAVVVVVVVIVAINSPILLQIMSILIPLTTITPITVLNLNKIPPNPLHPHPNPRNHQNPPRNLMVHFASHGRNCDTCYTSPCGQEQ